METMKIEETHRTTGLVASVVLAIALAVAVTLAWGYGNVGQTEASGTAAPAAVDLNGDGQVALGDVIMVARCLGKTTSYSGCESCDVNNDNHIALGDLMLVVKHFGQLVPAED